MTTQAEVIDQVLAGRLSIESIEDRSVRELAIRAYQDQERRRNEHDRLARLTSDVGIVGYVAMADDIPAAMKRLQGRKKEAPVWETNDGYLFVHGYDSKDVAAALIATRRKGPG